MERAADVQAARARAGLVARGLAGRLDRVERAGEHELARRVVVGDGQAEAGGQRAHRVGVAAEHGHHAARARCAASRHRGGALVDERDGVLELQRPGGDEGRVLAQRVPGGGDRQRRPPPAGLAARPQAATEHRNSAGCW